MANDTNPRKSLDLYLVINTNFAVVRCGGRILVLWTEVTHLFCLSNGHKNRQQVTNKVSDHHGIYIER